MPPVITLTTDFGLDDPYVGQMKGAILCRNPAAQIVDLCHSVPAQDVLAGAVILHTSSAFFPPGAVHLAVVDPGVGTGRRILGAASAEQLFIAPDNGLLSLLFTDNTIQRVRLLTNPRLFAQTISPTFHGRDIMAPAAAMLAGGFPFESVGPLAEIDACVRLHLPRPVLAEGRMKGQVVQSDHFGNLRTNITKADVKHFAPSGQVTVSIRGQQAKLRSTYADAPPGSLIALIDSTDFLELAANMGSAAKLLQCGPGEPVKLLI